MKKNIIVSLLVVSILLLTNCKNKVEENNKNVDKKINQEIEVSNAWMTPGAKNRNSAAYFTLTNNLNIPDTLFEASSNLSELTELHETYKKTEEMLGMRSVPHVIIPAKEKFNFAQGGFHVMLIGLNENFKVKSNGKITLKFKVAGTIIVPLVCRLSQKKKSKRM